MFLFKKVIAALLAPLPLCLITILVGLLFLLFSQKKRTGSVLIFIGTICLTLLSLTPVSNLLRATLEDQHPSYLAHPSNATDHLKFIVVLGGGHTTDPTIPISSQIGSSTLARLTEGVRLHRITPNSQLILSGGNVFSDSPEAETMRAVAMIMGVSENDMILDRLSKDTKDQAINIKGIVKESHFILVTSASHMPRSIALFKKQGLQPIPAPTRHQAIKVKTPGPGYYFPNASALRKSEQLIHEYLGITWAKLRGQI